MGRYCVKKIVSLLPVLLGITLAAFLLGVVSPGNPAELALSQGGYQPTEEQIQEMEHQMGLDLPLPAQYLRWVGRALTGDLGQSYASGRPVLTELMLRLPVTLLLAGAAMALCLGGGLALGCVAAACRGRWPDRVIGGFTALQLSLPAFWLALLLVLLFAETLGWLPTSGLRSPKGILLPALVLSWAPMASAARLTRSALLEQLARPYCLAARARGVSRVRLIWHNALPNALPPVVSLLGNTLGGLLGGSVVVESIFALPGLGAYALSAVTNRDYPALQGYVLVTGLVYVAVATGVDLISMVLDPRIRLGGKAL